MKISKYILMMFASAALLSSCKKEFLDQTPPTAVGVGLAIKTESDLSDALNGMYNAMRSSSFFGRDIPVLGDQLADNAYITSLSNSGRYLNQQTYNFTVANTEASNIWTQGYYVILQANRIIYAANQGLANGQLTSTNAFNQYRGEAYAARALAYLQLVNFFATPATVNPNANGVPLITSPTVQFSVDQAFSKPARASVAAVYNKIISDLDSAYTTMPNTSTRAGAATSQYLSKFAAKAIQARAYLYKGDYTNARDAALAVVQNGGYTLTAASNLINYWSGTVNGSAKVETLFELSLNTLTNNGTNGLDYIYSPSGYGDLLPYTDLYNLYSATDARKGLIINGTRSSTPILVNNKFPNTTLTSDKDDIKIIRYAENLLTLAEGYARSNDPVNALIYLNQVAKQRDPSFAGYVSTGDALINDILQERRKELAFEGLRYFDLQRTNAAVVRPTQANRATNIATVAAGDYRRILPIPQSEVDANPTIVQNPGYAP